MDLFIIIIAIAFTQVWGSQNPVHKDEWYRAWIDKLAQKLAFSSSLLALVTIGLPLFAAFILMLLAEFYSLWLLLPISVLIVLYSFGRNEFSDIVSEYTRACSIEDWSSAVQRASSLGVQTEDLNEGDWSLLHQHVLDEAGYRGFERIFAILFWFFVLGPLGALFYRLTFLYVNGNKASVDLAQKVLWLLEWPAVRLLGVSFALTGNFVGSYQRWKECLVCLERPTKTILGLFVLGALSVDDEVTQSCEVTRKELDLLHKLYKRTLWFWLAVISLLIIAV